jgi:hypothetical protein
MSPLRRIRKALRERLVELSDHALEEMDNDHLTLADVRTVLMEGSIHATQEHGPGGVRYVVRGEIDGEDVDVVCRFLASGILLIITVFVVKEVDEDNE